MMRQITRLLLAAALGRKRVRARAFAVAVSTTQYTNKLFGLRRAARSVVCVAATVVVVVVGVVIAVPSNTFTPASPTTAATVGDAAACASHRQRVYIRPYVSLCRRGCVRSFVRSCVYVWGRSLFERL